MVLPARAPNESCRRLPLGPIGEVYPVLQLPTLLRAFTGKPATLHILIAGSKLKGPAYCISNC